MKNSILLNSNRFYTLSIAFFFMVGLCFVTSSAFAQKNIIEVQPLELFIGKATIGYERALTPSLSVEARYQNWFVDSKKGTGLGIILNEDTETLSISGNRVYLGGKYYFKGQSRGFYMHSSAFLGKHSIEYNYTIDPSLLSFFLLSSGQSGRLQASAKNITTIGFTGDLGYRMVKGNFTMSFSAGFTKSQANGTMNLNTRTGDANDKNPPSVGEVFNGLTPRVNLTMGVAF